MKKPAPGLVILSAIRLAAFPAPNGVSGLASSSKDWSTITLAPVAGSCGAVAFTKLTGPATPNTDDSNEKVSVGMEKFIKSSPPTTCRPGVVKTFVPAKGSESKRKVVACAVEHSARRAPAQ